MQRRYALLVLISTFIVACSVSLCWARLLTYGLPFTVTVIDAHTAVIQPSQGFELPVGIQAGDRIDLRALDQSARAAITITNLLGRLPLGQTYQLVMQRDAHSFSVPVTTVDLGKNQRVLFTQLIYVGFFGLMGLLALLTLWRGRNRAAGYMTLWLTVFLFGATLAFVALDGIAGLSVQLGAVSCYLLARISFYLMIETLVTKIFKQRTLMLVRASFILVLGAGAAVLIGGPIIYVTSGWAGLLQPAFGVIFTAGYLVPAILLLLSYGRAALAQRPQIRWFLVSTAALLVGIFFSNTLVLDATNNALVQGVFFVLSITGFVYAVLRHRVVDISVVIDRTLVYAGMTALVVGVLAAVNNLIQHTALGANASLLLQVTVPLTLGILLSHVRIFVEKIVDRVFFRKKYLAEKALRSFARHSGKYEQADQLFKAAVAEIRRQMGAVACAIYERKGMGYVCVYQQGEVAYPTSTGIDDSAFVAARSERKDTDLTDIRSVLGTDGYVFPMAALGELQGVLVCANRPGEHYAADERKLLIYVAHQMGLALYALRMRARNRLIDALASGSLPVTADIQAKARELAYVTE